MNYEVFIEKAAQRSLARVPQPYQERMIAAIVRLSDEPRPAGAKKLAGREAWRIRIGDFRIIYEIDDEIRKVLVVSAGNRRDIYRH